MTGTIVHDSACCFTAWAAVMMAITVQVRDFCSWNALQLRSWTAAGEMSCCLRHGLFYSAGRSGHRPLFMTSTTVHDGARCPWHGLLFMTWAAFHDMVCCSWHGVLFMTLTSVHDGAYCSWERLCSWHGSSFTVAYVMYCCLRLFSRNRNYF
jgi:nitrite reductase/ring-hydroxylating ferredoxin subunit